MTLAIISYASKAFRQGLTMTMAMTMTKDVGQISYVQIAFVGYWE